MRGPVSRAAPELKSAYDAMAHTLTQAGVPHDAVPSVDALRMSDNALNDLQYLAIDAGKVAPNDAHPAIEAAIARFDSQLARNYRSPDEIEHTYPGEVEAELYAQTPLVPAPKPPTKREQAKDAASALSRSIVLRTTKKGGSSTKLVTGQSPTSGLMVARTATPTRATRC